MADYQLSMSGVQRLSDGAFIPDDEGNSDWHAYQSWLAAGNTPDPAPGPTPVELQAQVDAIREAKLAAGFADSVTGKTYPCDPLSIGKLGPIGASAGISILMGITPAPQFEIITADNSIITLGPTAAFQLLNGRVMPWVSAVSLYARQLKNEIEAGGSPDITAGWP